MSGFRLVADFIEGSRGRILVVAHIPDAGAVRSVVVVPPFAEEMNKSRPMIAGLARELAALRIATVLPDLYGTGDSAGEFRDACWDDWIADTRAAVAWACDSGWSVDSIVGIRLGCALGAQAARSLPARVRRSIFWAPVHDGSGYLTQFLRLRTAATMMSDGAGETTSALRSRLAAGETLEVAGYELNPGLARRIDELRLPELVGPGLGDLTCIDVSRANPPVPSEATRIGVARIAQRVDRVEAAAVAGEPFWSATETLIIPELVNRSVNALAAAA